MLNRKPRQLPTEFLESGGRTVVPAGFRTMLMCLNHMSIENDKERYYSRPVDVCEVLRTLKSKHCSINLQFDNSPLSYYSLILDVDSQEHHFLLEEVKPPEGHHLIDTGTPFSIRAAVNGIRVHASGMQLAETLNDQSGVLYRVPFPAKVLYLQRRDAFRTPVPTSLTAHASLYSNKRLELISAGVVDVSMTGVRLRFTGEISPTLEIEELFDLQISIPALDQMISAKAELRNQRYDGDCDQTVCGFRFVNVNRISQTIVTRFIAQLQQESQTDL